MVVAHVRLQSLPQVGFPEEDHMVEASPSDRTDEPLNVTILPGRPRRRGSISDPLCSETPDDRIAVNRIPMSDHVLGSFIPREGIISLTCDPLRRRMARHVHRYGSAPIVGTTRKSIAPMPDAWFRMKVFQLWEAGRLPFTIYLATVD